MGGLAEYESGRFRLPKSLQEDSLFAQANTKSTQYKGMLAVEVFRNFEAVREQIFPSVISTLLITFLKTLMNNWRKWRQENSNCSCF